MFGISENSNDGGIRVKNLESEYSVVWCVRERSYLLKDCFFQLSQTELYEENLKSLDI